MKKIITIMLATLTLIATMLFFACENGKSVPNDPEVAKANLEAAGYTVELENAEKWALLSANKEDSDCTDADYDESAIMIYYCKDEVYANIVYEALKKEIDETKKELNEMENDPVKDLQKKMIDKMSYHKNDLVVFMGDKEAIDAANGK